MDQILVQSTQINISSKDKLNFTNFILDFLMVYLGSLLELGDLGELGELGEWGD